MGVNTFSICIYKMFTSYPIWETVSEHFAISMNKVFTPYRIWDRLVGLSPTIGLGQKLRPTIGLSPTIGESFFSPTLGLSLILGPNLIGQKSTQTIQKPFKNILNIIDHLSSLCLERVFPDPRQHLEGSLCFELRVFLQRD